MQSTLGELESALVFLKSLKRAKRLAGRKGMLSVISANSQGDLQDVRVEIPVGSNAESAREFVTKLLGHSDMKIIENPKIHAGIRVFQGDTLYDGSLASLVQNI